MARSAKHFEEFEPHSRHKHAILAAYFAAWGRKLLLRRGAGDTLCYVDACAGKGRDDAGNPGSPVIAAEAAAAAESQLASAFGRQVRIRVIAIEKKRSSFLQLQKNLAPFADRADAVRGTLADHIGEVEREFHGVPTLYFIDPFGLEPLRAEVVKRALRGERNEAFLLFADQAALRHFGAATSTESLTERALRRHDETPSLFAEDHAHEREVLAAEAQRSREAREISRDSALRIMDAALGAHTWLAEIEAAPTTERRSRFLSLYTRLLEEFGAKYVTAFPVLKKDGAHVYHLIHASKSGAGRRTMKEAVEHALNHGPLPEQVREQLRYELRTDLDSVVRDVSRRFAGASVRWAPDADDRYAESIKNWALEETAIFPSWLRDLKVALQLYRDRSAGRVQRYRFPAV